MTSLLIHNVRIFTGREVVGPGYVAVDGEHIVDVAAGAPPPAFSAQSRIDGGGRWLMPGLIDAHAHLCYQHRFHRERGDPAVPDVAAANARAKLGSGVTTVRDVGGIDRRNIDIGRAIERGDLPGPRVIAAGDFIAAPGGHCHYWAREARGAPAIREAVGEQLDAGAKVIKLMASGGVAVPGERPTEAELTDEEIGAAVSESHARGVRVAAHAHPAEAIGMAVAAGCDTIEHGTWLDPHLIAQMVERGTALVPTLSVYDRMARNVDGIDERLSATARTIWERKLPLLREAWAAGVQIGVGTDAGSYFPSDDIATELELLVEIGLSPAQALEAATAGNADILGLGTEIGLVEPEKVADILLVDGEPLQDVGDVRRLWRVVVRGHSLDPAITANAK